MRITPFVPSPISLYTYQPVPKRMPPTEKFFIQLIPHIRTTSVVGDSKLMTFTAIIMILVIPIFLSFCSVRRTNAWAKKQCNTSSLKLLLISILQFTLRHFFLPTTFAADLVSLPSVSFFSTDLMTPTATVCFMSRTANRPRGW